MKKMKKMMALVIALVMVLAMGTSVFAQEKASGAGGSATIKITNAAKGETYKVYKLFDATVDGKGAISYTGDIPTALADYFTKDSVGVIRKAEGKTDAQITEAVKSYVAGLTSGDVVSETSDGTPLTFTGLAYGYYGVTSSQGSVVTVDSTNPNAEIIDKNDVIPQVSKKVNGKDVEDAHIGETVTFTAKFGPLANFIGDGESAEQVKSYTISDTLPEFLTNVAITEVKIYNGDPEATENAGTMTEDLSSNYTSFGDAKKIVIPWVDDADPAASLYVNKSYITIKYTAKIGDNPVINSADLKNVNTVTITPNKDKTGDNPFNKHWEDDAEVKTYGAALKKVDGSSNALKGAKFTIDGYEVEAVAGEAGVYKITGEKTGASAEMSTNDDGLLYILGMDDNLTVTETKAPDGYNKLEGTTTLEKQVLSHEIWTASGDKYYDAKGNLVSESSTSTTTIAVQKNYTDLAPNALKIVNNKGTELPSTGGIGTTIFYIVGAILVIGAGILLVTRRRMNVQ